VNRCLAFFDGKVLLPTKSWIVERTFEWLIQSRWILRDCEVLPLHSESMIDPSKSQKTYRISA
jgi:hypothetical protein